MSAGHIQRRGKASWRLKFEGGTRDPQTGKRKIQYVTVRGTKREAQVKLAELIASVGNSSYVEPSKLTAAEHVTARVEQWQADYDPATKTGISDLTAEGYRELTETHIVPHLGAKLIQKLTTLDIEGWHTALRRKAGARTIERAHRVLSQALADAVRHGLLIKNVAAIQGAPTVDAPEVPVVRKERIGELVHKLRGRDVYPIAIASLFTGMRRGEVLARSAGCMSTWMAI
jgi:integrase